MNRERLLKLADTLEKVENNQFDMRDWFSFDDEQIEKNMCGAPSCMAGWANYLFGEVPHYNEHMSFQTKDKAAELLDICMWDADILFTPPSFVHIDDPVIPHREIECHTYSVNGKQAAKVIRHFVATGHVDWEKAFELEIENA